MNSGLTLREKSSNRLLAGAGEGAGAGAGEGSGAGAGEGEGADAGSGALSSAVAASDVMARQLQYEFNDD